MRTFLDLDPQDAGGAQEGARPGRRGTQGTRCPPYASPTPRKGQRRRPPSDSRRGRPGRRGTQWARGPRRRPRLGCRKGKGNGRRAEGEGGRGGPAARRAGGRGTRLPHRRPNKDAGGTRARALPGWPGARRGGGGRLAPPSGREAPSWAGGGNPRSAPRGEEPPPRRNPRRQPRARWWPPGRPAPAPARGGSGGSAGKPGAPRGGRGRDGGESWVRVCFVLPGWLRACPRGRTRWPGERGPPRPRSGRPGAALAGSLPAPRPGLSGSASPSSSRPPARTLARSRSLD